MLDAVDHLQDENKLKVLLVEDQQVFRQIAMQCLGPYTKLIAKDAKTGLQLFKEECPDVTFLDIRLPDGNGLDLLEKFRQINPLAYIAIMTSSTDKADYERARQQGAAGFVRKPFSQDAVQKQVAHYHQWIKHQKTKAVPKPSNDSQQLLDGYKLLRQRLNIKIMPHIEGLEADLRKELKSINKYIAMMAGDNTTQPIDMALVIEKSIVDLQPQITTKKARITHNNMPTLQGDLTQIETAFNCLLHYALETDSNEITVSYIEKEEQCTFIITLSHLNEAIHTIDNRLALAKKVIEEHKGKLAAVNNTIRLYWQREDLY